MSFAALTQPNVAAMVEAAALLCPITYLGHVTAPLVERMVSMHLDQVISWLFEYRKKSDFRGIKLTHFGSLYRWLLLLVFIR